MSIRTALILALLIRYAGKKFPLQRYYTTVSSSTFTGYPDMGAPLMVIGRTK